VGHNVYPSCLGVCELAEQAKIANLQEKIQEAMAIAREGNILFLIGAIIVVVYIGLH
jgi:hypothetical protein